MKCAHLTQEKVKVVISPLCVVDIEVFINEKVKVTMGKEKVKVMILPLCVVDIEVFINEKVKVTK